MGSLVQRVVVFIKKVKLSKRNVRTIEGLPGGAEVKNLPASAGDVGSIPGSGRSPRVGNGNSLQYSCLENPMDREICWAIGYRVAKSTIEQRSTTQHNILHKYMSTEKNDSASP